MKKLVLLSYILAGASAALFAQAPKIHPETPEARETFQKMLASIEAEKDPYDLADRLDDLEKKLLGYRNLGMRYQPRTTREIAIGLIKVFSRLDDTPIGGANKVRIVEMVGITDNSQEAHNFFLDILENGTERSKKMALFSIWPRGVRGDDIYDKVRSLVERGRLKRVESLDPLKRANPERAIKEIQDFLATTGDVSEFKGVGRILSEYKRPELMEVVLDRYPEMKKKWKGDFRNDPARSIEDTLLIALSEKKEGPRLKLVLEMLNQYGTSGEETLPIIVKKLESKDEISRSSALDFLRGQVRQGNLKAAKVKPLVEATVKSEKDKAIRAKGEELLKELR